MIKNWTVLKVLSYFGLQFHFYVTQHVKFTISGINYIRSSFCKKYNARRCEKPRKDSSFADQKRWTIFNSSFNWLWTKLFIRIELFNKRHYSRYQKKTLSQTAHFVFGDSRGFVILCCPPNHVNQANWFVKLVKLSLIHFYESKKNDVFFTEEVYFSSKNDIRSSFRLFSVKFLPQNRFQQSFMNKPNL